MSTMIGMEIGTKIWESGTVFHLIIVNQSLCGVVPRPALPSSQEALVRWLILPIQVQQLRIIQ